MGPIDSPRPSGPGRSSSRAARVAGASPVLMGGLGFTGRRPGDDDVWAPFGAASLVLPQLASCAARATARRSRGRRSTRADDLDRRWAALERRARELEPSPNGMVARPVFAPLTIEAEQPSTRGLGPPGRHVRRGRRPGTDRQGGARPAGGAPVARRARRRERPSPAGRERTGEHDLRVPARRPDVPRLDARAPCANRRPLVPDDGRGRLDPPRRRCRRGRGPGRRPARLREGSRGAGHRRRLDPGPAGADRRDASRSRPSRRS